MIATLALTHALSICPFLSTGHRRLVICLLSSLLPQPAQQPGRAERIVEGTWAAFRSASAAVCSWAPASRSSPWI